MPTVNHYAAPETPYVYRANVNVPSHASSGAPVGPLLNRLRLGFGLAHVVSGMIALGGIVAGLIARDMDVVRTSSLGIGASLVFLFAWILVDVIWIHRFWSWIPPQHRYTSLWRRYISPSAAWGFLFVPLFGFYWMLVLYLGLDEIMERLRVETPCSKPPVKTLALMTFVVFIVFWPAAPIVSYLFCRRLEEMADEMQLRRSVTPVGANNLQAANL